jgi:hypothetical protein
MDPKVEITPDREAVLRGVHYQDLRAILTAAALHRYRELAVAKASGDETAIAYQQSHLNLIDDATKSLMRAIIES